MSSQRPIDLLPREILERSLARLRATRIISTMVIMTIIGGVLATHARLTTMQMRQRLDTTEQKADRVLDIERRAQRLRDERAVMRTMVVSYAEVAHPLNVGDVLATVINELPESATIESIELTAGSQQARTARRRVVQQDDKPAPRVLIGEIGGFAMNDQQIATFVQSLSNRAPFEHVALDFSRTRVVRGRPARAFRMSFRIDLERRYDVEYGATASASTDSPLGEDE